jgi:thiol-disulfide isomerase/thioredoxin
MKRFFCFLGLFCLFFRVGAQENNNMQALKIGDKVPELQLANLLNDKTKGVVRLSDFKGKLLIIDFWATSCGACIQAMPRLDSLEKVFGGKVVILPATAEKADRVTAFQRSNAFLKGWKFRTVVADKVLSGLFPHRLLPHEVWIDGDGVVLGFTEASDVTGTAIERALAGKGVGAGMKADVLDYDRGKPLLVQGNGGSDTMYRYRSVITGALKGLPSGTGFSYDSVKRMTVVKAVNVSVRRLYTLAFKGLGDLPDSRVDLGQVSGLFCYELDLPAASPGLVRRSIREDLDRFFGVRSVFTGTVFRLAPLTGEEDGPLTL